MSDYGRLRTAMQTAGLAKFLLFTDLRLRLVYPATEGSETLGQPDDLVKYYYAIADIQVIAGLNFTFLQRVSIACYAERCISHSKSVRPSVCLSVRLSVTRWH